MKEKLLKNSDKIYFFHNKRCSKSKEVKKYLDENNVKYSVVDYLNILPDTIKLNLKKYKDWLD